MINVSERLDCLNITNNNQPKRNEYKSSIPSLVKTSYNKLTQKEYKLLKQNSIWLIQNKNICNTCWKCMRKE